MIDPVQFVVLGAPAPQGSKTPVRNKAGLVVGVREDSPGLRPWRKAIVAETKRVRDEIGVTLDGPLMIEAQFRLAMPASRPAWAKQAGKLLSIVPPDLDKLIRALGDGCKLGGLIHDDARFAIERLTKIEVWQAWTGVVVRITPIDPAKWALS